MELGFKKACEHFDRGEYFEAHEEWESLWMAATGARHAYLQGLIQVAVGLHHAGNENWKGTRKLFASALQYLAKGAAEALEVDVEQLSDLVLDFELALQKKLSGEAVELPFFRLPYRAP